MSRPRWIVLVLAALLPARAGLATTAADLCAPAATSCTVSTNVTVTDMSVLDFGTRPLTIANGGTLDVGPGTMIILAASLTVSPGGKILARGRSVSPSGGIVSVTTTGDIRFLAGSPAARLDTSSEGQGGTVTLTAGGNVEIGILVEMQATTALSVGGNFIVNATGTVTVAAGAEIRADGGGEGFGGSVGLTGLGGVVVNGPIDVTGGAGGTIDMLTDGNITTAVAAHLNANATALVDDGGDVDLFALGDITLAGPISAHGTGSAFEESGGFGGFLTVEAFGSITFQATAAMDYSGGSQDGEGGEITLDAGVDLVQLAPLQARATGIDGAGGFIDLTAGRHLTTGTIDAEGGGFGGGEVSALVGDTATVAGTINADGVGGGGFFDISAEHIVVTGNVHLNGLAGGGGVVGAGGDIDFIACDIDVRSGARLETSGSGGRNLLQASAAITLRTGSTMLAGPASGVNELHHRLPGSPPTIEPGAVVSPAPTIVLNPLLPPCQGVCGNGAVDGVEQCDDGNTLPGDCCSATCQFEANGSACADDGNPCTNDTCNGAGACVHPNNTAPCNDGLFCNGADVCGGGTCQHAGNPCAAGPECANTCNEAADNCFAATGTACTDDGSVCTLDRCDGAGACTHPAGNAGTVCRAAAGACDVAEVCNGVATACPADVVSGAGVGCRPAAGECDVAESCDGVSGACPADVRRTAGTPCTADASACTLDECNGTSAVCQHPPGNAGTVCRPAAGECDLAESCTGTTASCPPNLTVPDGTPCTDDGDACTADVCQAGVCGSGPSFDVCLDDFLCYKAGTTRGTPAFVPIPGLPLADDFESGPFVVKKPVGLCTPADKNGEGTVDLATHLERYKINLPVGAPEHVRRVGVRMTNQLGTLSFDTRKADSLLVPAAKSLVAPPPPPDPQAHDVDHYKCYKVGVTPGTPGLPKGLQVAVADQFTAPPKVLDVKKPRLLCNPVDKNGEGIRNPARHLVCYKVKPAEGQPPHLPRIGVFVTGQFGPEQLSTKKEDLLCIPSAELP
jgi:cysteine-rich repeat protein